MANSKYVRIQTDNEAANRIQDNVEEAIPQQSDIGRGSALTGLNLAAGTHEVPHKLGRRSIGGTVIGNDNGGATIIIQESAVDPEKFVRITVAGGTVNANFWVF